MVDMTRVTHVVCKDGQVIHAFGNREEVVAIFAEAAQNIGDGSYGLVRFSMDTPAGPTVVDMEYTMLYLIGRDHDAENLHGPGTPQVPGVIVGQTPAPDVMIA